MQTAPTRAAYLAQDKFEWVDKLAPSPEMAYGEFHGFGAIEVASVRRNAAKMRSILIVLTRNFCGATVALWRIGARSNCARLVYFM